MNPTALHPHRRPTRTPALPYGTCVCDECEASQIRPTSPSQASFLEPGSEGIVFAVACVLCSSMLYGAVLLFRFLA
jgi:hypothetical protein